MIIAMIVFVVVAATVAGVVIAVTGLPEKRARRRVELRLQEVSRPEEILADQSLVMRRHEGRCPPWSG